MYSNLESQTFYIHFTNKRRDCHENSAMQKMIYILVAFPTLLIPFITHKITRISEPLSHVIVYFEMSNQIDNRKLIQFYTFKYST